MNVGYIRVSSVDQKTDRQLEDVKVEKLFQDKASAASFKNLPGLNLCIDFLREGDVLHVHSIDRLARNLSELQQLIKHLTDKGVSVCFHKEKLDFSSEKTNLFQMLLFQVLGAFSEFERSIIKERQKEGIVQAKKKGIILGRPKSLTETQKNELINYVLNGESVISVAKKFGVSRYTVYRAMKGQVKKNYGKIENKE